MSTMETVMLGVRVEVWPVAADAEGIWLLSETPDGQPDAWRSDPVSVLSGCHLTAERLLRAHPGRGARSSTQPRYWAPIPTPDEGSCLGDVQLLHSTSWRPDEDAVIVTYVAVLGGHGPGEFALDVWPHARPVGLDLADAVGKPITVAAVDAPLPRDVDVLLHGIRHLRFLIEYDAPAAASLDACWHSWLADLQPALAGMYQA